MRKWSSWLIMAAGLLWAAKNYYDRFILGRWEHRGYEANLPDYLFTGVPLFMAFGIYGMYVHSKARTAKSGRTGLLMAIVGNVFLSLSLIAEAWLSGLGIGYFSMFAGPGLLLQVIGYLLFGLAAIRTRQESSYIGWASLLIGMITAAWPMVSFVTYNLNRNGYGELISTQYSVPLAIIMGLCWVVLGGLFWKLPNASNAK